MFDFLATNMPLLILFGVVSIAVLVISPILRWEIDRSGRLFPPVNHVHGCNGRIPATSIPEIAAHYTASVGILSGALDYEVSSAVVLGANIGSDVVPADVNHGYCRPYRGRSAFQTLFLWKSRSPWSPRPSCVSSWRGRDLFHAGWRHLFGTFIAYMYYLYNGWAKTLPWRRPWLTEDGEKPREYRRTPSKPGEMPSSPFYLWYLLWVAPWLPYRQPRSLLPRQGLAALWSGSWRVVWLLRCRNWSQPSLEQSMAIRGFHLVHWLAAISRTRWLPSVAAQSSAGIGCRGRWSFGTCPGRRSPVQSFGLSYGSIKGN